MPDSGRASRVQARELSTPMGWHAHDHCEGTMTTTRLLALRSEDPPLHALAERLLALAEAGLPAMYRPDLDTFAFTRAARPVHARGQDRRGDAAFSGYACGGISAHLVAVDIRHRGGRADHACRADPGHAGGNKPAPAPSQPAAAVNPVVEIVGLRRQRQPRHTHPVDAA